MQKAQGAPEYLLLIGGAILVAVIIVSTIVGLTGSAGNEAEVSVANAQCAKFQDNDCDNQTVESGGKTFNCSLFGQNACRVKIGEPLTNCGTPIVDWQEGGVYYLRNNVSSSSGECFLIDKDNVIINCLGFETTANNPSGAVIKLNANNATISNCRINNSGNGDGIIVNGSGNKITGNTNINSATAILVEDGSENSANLISNNNACNTTGTNGISILEGGQAQSGNTNNTCTSCNENFSQKTVCPCLECPPVCGNGTCEPPENSGTCPADCPPGEEPQTGSFTDPFDNTDYINQASIIDDAFWSSGFMNPDVTTTTGQPISTSGPLGTGLLALLHMNGNTTDSENNNSVTAFGGTTCNATGVFGQGCSFDGADDYLRLDLAQYSSSAIPAGTIAFWVNRSNPSAEEHIVSRVSSRPIVRLQSNGTVMADVYTTTSNAVTANNALLTGWNHIAFVWGTTQYNNQLYVNGESKQTGTYNGTYLFSSDGDWFLGESSAGGKYFTGTMDEFAIWDRVLSPTEIQELAAGNNPVTTVSGSFESTTLPPTAIPTQFKTLSASWVETASESGVQLEVSLNNGSTWCALSNGAVLNNAACPYPATSFKYRVTFTGDTQLDSITFNWSDQPIPECGNGVIELGEECDTTNIGAETCSTQGYVSGTLACNTSCEFDFTNCSNEIPPECSNGTIEGLEECDCGSDGVCTADELNFRNCTNFGLIDGTLSCNNIVTSSDCTINTSACIAPPTSPDTIFVDLQLTPAGCPNKTYSITGRDCSAPAGDGYDAFNTVQDGMSTAIAGQTIEMRGGTYAEKDLNFKNSGTSSNYITLQGRVGETVTLTAAAGTAQQRGIRFHHTIGNTAGFGYYNFKNFKMTNYIVPFEMNQGTFANNFSEAPHHINFEDIDFYQNRRCIYGRLGAHDITAVRTKCHDNTFSGGIGSNGHDFDNGVDQITATALPLGTGGPYNITFIDSDSWGHNDGGMGGGDADSWIFQAEVHDITMINCRAWGNSEDGIDFKGDNATLINVQAWGNGATALKLGGAEAVDDQAGYDETHDFAIYNSTFVSNAPTGVNGVTFKRHSRGTIVNSVFVVLDTSFNPDGRPGNTHGNSFENRDFTIYNSIFYTQRNSHAFRSIDNQLRFLLNNNIYHRTDGGRIMEFNYNGAVTFMDPIDINDKLNGDWSPFLASRGAPAGLRDEDAKSVDPLFVSLPDNLRLQPGSPAIDAGKWIAGYHCATADDNPTNPMNPTANCRHWKGTAPDIGAFEYG